MDYNYVLENWVEYINTFGQGLIEVCGYAKDSDAYQYATSVIRTQGDLNALIQVWDGNPDSIGYTIAAFEEAQLVH